MGERSTAEQLARYPQSETRIRLTLRPTSRGKIVGRHPAMHRVLETIERVADTPASVLITGESGTGKELVVAALHDRSDRANGPLVTVDCGAIPDDRIEAELFGHAGGESRRGLVAAAEGGTLFLDEVGELPLEVQVKLLRLLQRREYAMVGDSRVHACDVRIVAATNRDLEAAVTERSFREDLYYRLNIVHVKLPALRDRADDIELLAEHFVRVAATRAGRAVTGLTPEALAALRAFPWPGNVRSLENTIERAVLFAGGSLVGVEDLPEDVRQSRSAATPGASEPTALPDAGIDLRSLVEQYENQLISAALTRTNGNKNRAARLLGLNRTTLVEKLKRKRI
jgi:DNA-binding NtrC family response regulator